MAPFNAIVETAFVQDLARAKDFYADSARIAAYTTRMHISFVRYGRFRRTSFSKYAQERAPVVLEIGEGREVSK